MKNKKVDLEKKQQVWEARFQKRSSEQARREHEDSLKFFQVISRQTCNSLQACSIHANLIFPLSNCFNCIIVKLFGFAAAGT